MSHRLIVRTKDYGDVCLFHSSDWSGTVRIIYRDRSDTEQETELPGSLLKAISMGACAESLRSYLIEQLDAWNPHKEGHGGD